MKIGIIGSGFIGGTLAKRLSAAGHTVKVANSRGPSTVEADVLSTGALAVTKEEALVEAGRPTGDPERIAAPVAADSNRDGLRPCHSSRTLVLTPIMPVPWRSLGDSSAAHLVIALR